MSEPLTDDQIQDALASLPDWRFEDNAIKKTFKCKNYREATSWIVRLAFSAEEQDHHAEIRNVYSRIDIALSTHDAGDKVTERDIRLAQAIEEFSWV